MGSEADIRALIALDAKGHPRILTTDSLQIALDMVDLGTDAQEIGVISLKDLAGMVPGLYLWTGSVKVVDRRGHEDLYPEWVPDYEGELRILTGPTGDYPELFGTLGHLFRMSPPESEVPDDDDRESPEPG